MGRIEGDKVNFGNSFVVSTQSSRILDSEISQAKQIAQKIVNDAKQQALIIEANANSKAESIIDEAKKQADSQTAEITEAARNNGFEQGYKEGFEKISGEMEEKITNLDKFAAAEFELKKRIIKSLHTDILDLVTALAKKVCHTELSQNPQMLEKLTIAAISSLKEKENITIIVNPQMAEKIYEISDKIKETFKNLETIRIIEDASVSPDGTIVESVGSRIDSRLEAQIEKIAQELYNKLNSTPETALVKEIEESEKAEMQIQKSAESAQEVQNADESDRI